MKEEISNKIRTYFSQVSIYKDPSKTNSIFAGRNLPAFVKDFLLKRYLDVQTGEIDTQGLTQFLDQVIPADAGMVKDKIVSGQEVVLLARFIIYIDLIKGQKQFAIPDYGIKLREGIIPEYTYNKHQGELVDGEKWGIVKLCLIEDNDGKRSMCKWWTTNRLSLIVLLMSIIWQRHVSTLQHQSGLICCFLRWNTILMALLTQHRSWNF